MDLEVENKHFQIKHITSVNIKRLWAAAAVLKFVHGPPKRSLLL